MLITEQYASNLMSKHYLVHANINEYVWFNTYSEALDFLLSKWVDRRIALEVYTPVK